VCANARGGGRRAALRAARLADGGVCALLLCRSSKRGQNQSRKTGSRACGARLGAAGACRTGRLQLRVLSWRDRGRGRNQRTTERKTERRTWRDDRGLKQQHCSKPPSNNKDGRLNESHPPARRHGPHGPRRRLPRHPRAVPPRGPRSDPDQIEIRSDQVGLEEGVLVILLQPDAVEDGAGAAEG
jgi:hypothetical protein